MGLVPLPKVSGFCAQAAGQLRQATLGWYRSVGQHSGLVFLNLVFAFQSVGLSQQQVGAP